jgi:hypothetical protein
MNRDGLTCGKGLFGSENDPLESCFVNCIQNFGYIDAVLNVGCIKFLYSVVNYSFPIVYCPLHNHYFKQFM